MANVEYSHLARQTLCGATTCHDSQYLVQSSSLLLPRHKSRVLKLHCFWIHFRRRGIISFMLRLFKSLWKNLLSERTKEMFVLRVEIQTYLFIGDEDRFSAWNAALRRTLNEQIIARGMTRGEFSFIELSSWDDRLKWPCTQGKEQNKHQDRYICLNIYSCGCNNAICDDRIS